MTHEQEIISYNQRREDLAEALFSAYNDGSICGQTFKYGFDLFTSSGRCGTMAEGRQFLDELEFDILIHWF
jgi:hypothetical protein